MARKTVVVNEKTLANQMRYKVPEMRLILIREPDAPEPITIEGPEDVDQFLTPLQYYSEEHFVALHLDAKNHVIGYHVVSHGTVSESLVHPREVFKAALLANSHSIIVAHNHPAGSLKPSGEDLQTTRMLIESGKLLGVRVVDHLIITAQNGSLSLREHHPDLW